MKIVALIALSMILVLPDAADAYIRPGGAGDFFNIIASALVSIGAFFKAVGRKFLSIFSRDK